MKQLALPTCLLAGSVGLNPAIVRGASTSVWIGSRQYQLGSPFDVRIDFEGRAPAGAAQLSPIVRDFLARYPAKRDYWEMVNRRLSRVLRGAFPAATTFSVTFSVEPDLFFPVSRYSRVSVDANGAEAESFEFDFPASISGRLHGIRVGYRYPPECPPDDMPDYRYVQQELLVFGSVHDFGRAADRRAAASFLLARFPTLADLSVGLDQEPGPRLPASEMQAGIAPLSADGGCQVRRRSPTEEIVFAPAEFCGGVRLPERPNRRYITPPLATGAGGETYAAEMRYVSLGLASGIVLPGEFAAAAARHGLVASAEAAGSWRGALLSNGQGRANPCPPVVCGVSPGWFPTCRSVGLLGLALPGAPLRAVLPAYLADRMVALDADLQEAPEIVRCRLLLFRQPARVPGDRTTDSTRPPLPREASL